MPGPYLFDRVKDTTTTTGTGSVTLANSAPAGFRTFGSVLADADSCFYCIAEQSGSGWEVGAGTYSTSGPTLARTTVYASSNAGAAVNFGSGTKDVFITAPATVLGLGVPPYLGSKTSFAPIGIPLPGGFLVGGLTRTTGSGDLDLYTVPTGKRAIMLSLAAYNTSVGSLSIYGAQKISGTTYRVTASNSVISAGLGTFLWSPVAQILEAGETFVVNVNGSGLNVLYRVFIWDAAIASVYSPRILSLSNGDNTLYTCPAGHVAWPVGLPAGVSSASPSPVYLFNTSGGSRSIIVYLVPSGGSPGSTNRTTPTTTVGNAALGQPSGVNIPLSAGDTIVVNTDSGAAGQFCWTNILEVPL